MDDRSAIRAKVCLAQVRYRRIWPHPEYRARFLEPPLGNDGAWIATGIPMRQRERLGAACGIANVRRTRPKPTPATNSDPCAEDGPRWSGAGAGESSAEPVRHELMPAVPVDWPARHQS